MSDTHFVGIGQLVTMAGSGTVPASAMEAHAAADDLLGVIPGGAIVCDEAGVIRWVGPGSELTPDENARTVDLAGAVVLPGLVDAHTHVVFAGDRTLDFAARCAGESYEDVARRGGGIRLTVDATRSASRETLINLARGRLRALLAHGVTTVEVKSGYGLGLVEELGILSVIADLQAEGPWRVVPTVLAAHVVPDAFRTDRAAYVRMVNEELLPEVARRGAATHMDVFCDEGAFTVDESLSMLQRGRELGLGLKVHGEQLTHTGISGEAARLGALSVDHLEHANGDDMDAMAEAGTTAVLLPGAAIYLGGAAKAPARQLLGRGIPVAVATDCNPGTCPSPHLPLMASLACGWLGMMPHEALLGVTRDAAHAVGLTDGRGTLVPSAPCDLAVCDVPRWQSIPYALGVNPVSSVWIGGRLVHGHAARG